MSKAVWPCSTALLNRCAQRPALSCCRVCELGHRTLLDTTRQDLAVVPALSCMLSRLRCRACELGHRTLLDTNPTQWCMRASLPRALHAITAQDRRHHQSRAHLVTAGAAHLAPGLAYLALALLHLLDAKRHQGRVVQNT